jgi:hypothetical protein
VRKGDSQKFGVVLLFAIPSEWREGRCESSYLVSMPTVTNALHCRNSHDLALLPQSSAVKPEYDRNGNHYSRETGEQSASPLYAQVGEHLASEKRESSRDHGSKHDVGGYGGGGAIGCVVSFLW